MTNFDTAVDGRASQASRVVREWWPLPALVATALMQRGRAAALVVDRRVVGIDR